jgi:hypothetical protein
MAVGLFMEKPEKRRVVENGAHLHGDLRGRSVVKLGAD